MLKSGTLPPADQRLDWRGAREEPCAGCAAGCCTWLPLRDFGIRTMSELDWAFYLLNFEGIELTVLSNGTWQASLVAECRHLSADKRCMVHRTEDQPGICKRFNPFGCSYKRIYHAGDESFALRMDRGRMEAFAAMLTFDGHRDIVEAPDFATLQASLPPLGPTARPIFEEPVDLRDRWEAEVRAGAPEDERPEKSWKELQDPCGGCAAWCCTRLYFPHDPPSNQQGLDHIRFLLGYPGVEVGVGADGSWTVIVKSRCRHLVRGPDGAGRCGVFGQPERPQVCTFYDAGACAYREHFGRPRPRGMVRVRHEEFKILADLFRFDPEGYTTAMPDAAAVRAALEAAWSPPG